ncbi:TolC family protein [Rhizobium sp. SSA_523]|uniref:TolC family protein n=1 Tax=Rhizobium sp. SSA_523 TaxID=2952477 RepID=UPI00258224C5|nr:TolC family protein [Rhizobium sp. SSA_523]MCO5732447.1 TolC family protein [Rhizobium sp. SSA_523]WKC22410.1 TolC family protein [Rhizobium sp. SSA_523]
MLRLPHPSARYLTSIILLYSVIIGSSAFSQEIQDFSQFELRLNQDSALRSIADARLRLATADLLPKVAAAGEWVMGGRISYSPDITMGSPNAYGKRDPSTLGVEVSWKLFDRFQNLNRIKAAREGVSYAAQASLDTRQTLMLERAERALEVIRARAIFAAYSQATGRRREASKLAKRLLNDELVTVSQVRLADAALEGAKATQKQAETAVDTAELAYQQFTGHPLPEGAVLDLARFRLPDSAGHAAERAGQQNPKVKMAVHLEQEADYQARAALGKFLPTISLVGRVARAFDTTPAIDRVDNSAVLMRASVPIFDATIAPAADLARTQALQRRWDRQDASLQLSTEARKQFEIYRSYDAQLRDIQKQTEGAKAAVKAVAAEIEAGERTVTDLLEAQQTALTATVALADAQHAKRLAGFRLLAVMGDLDPRDVGLTARSFR